MARVTAFEAVVGAALKMPQDVPQLSTLLRLYGSDKDRNGYTSLYNALFTPLRQCPMRLLEIGIGSSMKGYMPDAYVPGASLRAWRDYFELGEVHGMDIETDCMIQDESRITTHLCDSTAAEATGAWLKDKEPFDVIIDDGSHWYMHQLLTLHHLFPLVKPGGYYIIEDVTPDSPLSAQPLLVTDVVGDVGVFFAGVKKNLCVIHNVPLDCARLNF